MSLWSSTPCIKVAASNGYNANLVDMFFKKSTFKQTKNCTPVEATHSCFSLYCRYIYLPFFM